MLFCKRYFSPGPVNNPVGTERGGVFDYWLWLRTPWGKILTQVEVCHPGRKIQYGRHKIRSIGNLGRGMWKSQHVSRSFKVGSFERYWGIFSYKIIKNKKIPKSATRLNNVIPNKNIRINNSSLQELHETGNWRCTELLSSFYKYLIVYIYHWKEINS